nr:23S rRNA (adenine(2030)-N(6))-methyltransferase RlmJ [Aurantimonas aggregata]
MTRLVEYLKRKDKPFRVFDTHAGRGLYDLAADEAQRTGEFRDGVERIMAAAGELSADPLFSAYFEAIRPDIDAHRYPGSPLIARRLLRSQDRLSAYELHPADAAALRALFAGDVQVKAIELDAWLALGSHLPPKEKRGLVLIDPPFEKPSEIDDIAAGLARAFRRWPGGTYAVWYPLKRPEAVAALHRALAGLGADEVIVAEFLREAYSPDERFVGTGLAVINPPFVFAEEAETILARLVPLLGHGPTATARVFAPVAATP